jgi:hypothetical protein
MEEKLREDREWEDFVAARRWLREDIKGADCPVFVDEPCEPPDVIEDSLIDAPTGE